MVFNAKLVQATLITKIDFDATLLSLNKKITSYKTKYLLLETEFKKLKKFDSSHFIGKSHFEEDGTQNYLLFQPMHRYLKDRLMKILQLLPQVITNSIQN